jgi:hypothetical protein
MFSAVGVVPNIGKPDKRIDFTNRREHENAEFTQRYL